MEFEPQYLGITKVAAKDDYRPVLQALHVRRCSAELGTIEAADGHIAAVVPCRLDPRDQEGLIPALALTEARKRYPKEKSFLRVALDDPNSAVVGGIVYPRPTGTFPDILRVVQDALAKHDPTERCPWVGIDADQYQRLVRALGQHLTPAMMPTRSRGRQGELPSGPIVVHAVKPCPDGTPLPPYGLIMPTLGQSWRQWFDVYFLRAA
jgi:hypothetical protein